MVSALLKNVASRQAGVVKIRNIDGGDTFRVGGRGKSGGGDERSEDGKIEGESRGLHID